MDVGETKELRTRMEGVAVRAAEAIAETWDRWAEALPWIPTLTPWIEALGWLMIPAGVLFLLANRRVGLWLLRRVQGVDRKLSDGFAWLAWCPGAKWNPRNPTACKRHLRRAWFLGFYSLVFAVAAIAIVRDWPAWVQLGAVLTGFVVALSVGRCWVTAVNRMLEDDRDQVGEAERAGHLRNMAIGSLLIMLFLTPLSLHAVYRIAPDASFDLREPGEPATWTSATTSLMFKAAFDFADFFDEKNAITKREPTPQGAWGMTGVLFHFLAFIYVVVNGIVLASRCDHAMHEALKRLEKYGETGSVVKFGSRILPHLKAILQSGTPEAIGAAIRAITEISKQADRQLFQSREMLLRALEHPEAVVRASAAFGLGEAGFVQAVRPLFDRLKTDSDPEVRAAAAEGLGMLGEAVEHAELGARLQLEVVAQVRLAIVHALGDLPPKPNRGTVTVVRHVFSQDDSASVRAAAAETLRKWGDPLVRNEVGQYLAQLNSESEIARREAATRLGDFVDSTVVIKALLARFSIETDEWVRGRILKSLANVLHLDRPKYVQEIARLIRVALSEDGSAYVGRTGARLLGEFPFDQVTINALVYLLAKEQGTTFETRKAALLSLAKLGELDFVRDALSREDENLVEAVMKALTEMRSRQEFEQLRRYVDEQKARREETLEGGGEPVARETAVSAPDAH